MSTETQSRIWLRNYLPAFVWAAFILTLTLLPGTALPALRFMDAFRPDKVAHFMVFAIQALLLMTAFNKESVSGGAFWPAKYAALLAVSLSSGYGFLIELGQTLVPGRSYELADLTADSIGALIGVVLFCLIYKL